MLVDINQIISHFKIEKRGILHIGAHYGQEVSSYKSLGFNNIVAFEASKKNFEILRDRVKGSDTILVNKALGPKKGTCTLHVESKNEGMSNSLLEPKLHLQQYPHIEFKDVEEVEMVTLDSWVESNANFSSFNFICMDVQGYEFEVLLGSTETLKSIDCLVCEVNRAELYKNGAFITEVDLFLRTFGLRRVVTNWEGQTWGDACYVRDTYFAKSNTTMPKIGLVDINFAHSQPELGFDSACLLPTARFDWERNIRSILLDQDTKLVTFTDQMIENVDIINGKAKVAWIIEPEEINPNIRQRVLQVSNKFDAILTHDKKLISMIPNGRYCSVASSWIHPTEWFVNDKSKSVSIIASKKNQTSGHVLRHQAASLIDESHRYGGAYRPISNKIEALRDYKFSIAIENCRQDGFFTEKIIDPMIVGTVPIYWGCSDIGEYFDIRGILTFDNIDELSKILSMDIESWYNSRKEYIESNSKLARRFSSCDELFLASIVGVS